MRFLRFNVGNLFIVSLVMVFASCTSVLGDGEKRVSGTYILDRVDGALLPASLAPQQGCNRTVRKVAIFSLNGPSAEKQPLYAWEIHVDADCQPVPAGVFQGADDLGTWRVNSSRLSFRSMMGKGAYTGALEETSGNPPTITFSYLGTSYRFRRMDDPTGVVFVKVVDQFGQTVEGVSLLFTFRYGIEGGGTIGPAGEFGTSGPIGECTIKMTLPPGYEVPASQPNPFSVTVVEEPAIHVLVTVTKL